MKKNTICDGPSKTLGEGYQAEPLWGSGVRSWLVPQLTVVEIVTCSAKYVRKMTSMAERREREKSDQPSQPHERKCHFNQDYLEGLNFTHTINTDACQKQGRGR